MGIELIAANLDYFEGSFTVKNSNPMTWSIWFNQEIASGSDFLICARDGFFPTFHETGLGRLVEHCFD